MTRSATRTLLQYASAALILASTTANAVLIVDAGTTATTTHYLISSESSVAYNPDFFAGEATGPFTLSGSFTATVSNFWWDYFLDGDPLGTQGRFRYQANAIRFSNPALVGAITPAGFEFPTFAVALVDGQFGGSDDACPVPLPPDSYCTGFSMPPIASFSGELTANGLALTGFDPSGLGVGGFKYAIVASAVPEPGTAVLLALGLAALFSVSRPDARRRT